MVNRKILLFLIPIVLSGCGSFGKTTVEYRDVYHTVYEVPLLDRPKKPNLYIECYDPSELSDGEIALVWKLTLTQMRYYITSLEAVLDEYASLADRSTSPLRSEFTKPVEERGISPFMISEDDCVQNDS